MLLTDFSLQIYTRLMFRVENRGKGEADSRLALYLVTTCDTEAIRAGVGLGSGTEVNTHQSLQYAREELTVA